MNREVYAIKKTLISNGRKTSVFVTCGSEVLEMKYKNIAEKRVIGYNANTKSGCSYELITIGGKKNVD